MDKKKIEKIRNIAKGYLKQKTLKDKLKFLEENPSPILEEKEKFNFLNFMWRSGIGWFLILVSFALVSTLFAWLTTEYQNGLFLLGIPLYFYLLFKTLDWLD